MAAEYERAARAGASRWCLLALAAIFLLAMHAVLPNSGGSGGDLPQALLVWSLMLLLLAGGAWRLRGVAPVRTAFSRVILAAAVLLTLPLCWSPWPDWRFDALPRLAGLWAGVALYGLFINCRFSGAQRRAILWLIAIAALIQVAYTLTGIWFPQWLPEVGQQALRNAATALGVFQQRNVTASFLATGGAALLWLLADPRQAADDRRRRCLFGLAGGGVFLIYMTLLLLKSRIGWLGGIAAWLVIAATICWPVNRQRMARYLRLAILLLPPAGVLAGIGCLSGSLSQALHEHDGSNLDRIFILQQTWQMIVRHPLQGWGYGGFPWSFAHYLADRPTPLSLGNNMLTHPHNEVLFWWVEGGIIALAGMLALAVGGIALFFRRPTLNKMLALGAVLPVLLHTQVEFPLYQSPLHWLLLLLLLSFADSPAERQGTGRPLFSGAPFRLAPYLTMTLAAAGMLLTGYTLWQGQYLAAFASQPARYANQVLQLRETGIGTARLRKSRALSWIVHFQSSGDPDDLRQFSAIASRWLNSWSDADLYHNLIAVQRYLGRQAQARALQAEARRLYPDDARFGDAG